MHSQVLSRAKMFANGLGTVLLPLAAAAVAFISVAHCGMRGIETYDMSIVADGGWRIYNGQVPYKDFFMPIGPAVLILQALAYQLAGGYTWLALIRHAAAANALAVLFVFGILRPYLKARTVFLCSLLTGAVFYLPLAFPWYDTTTWLILLAGLWAAERAAVSSAGRRYFFSFAAGVLAAISLFSKINIGIFGVAGIGVIVGVDGLLAGKTGRKSALGFYLTGLAVMSVAGTVWLQSQGNFLGSLSQVATGQHVGARLQQVILRVLWAYLPTGFGRGRWIYNLSNLAGLLFAVWMIRLIVRKAGHENANVALAVRYLTVCGLHLLAFVTSGGHFSFYQPLLGLAMGYLLAFVKNKQAGDRPASLRVLMHPVFQSVSVLLFYLFSCHLAWQFFPSMQMPSVGRTFADGPFRGVTLREEVYRELDEVLSWNKTVDPKAGIFIFPEAQLLYGALARESPRQTRLWYHEGLTYQEDDPDTAAVIKAAPEYILLRKYGLPFERTGDLLRLHFSKMPVLEKFLRGSYTVDKELSGFTVLKRIAGRTG